MLKKISIIIPVYNTEKYIRKCLESIIQQTYANLGISVVVVWAKVRACVCVGFIYMDAVPVEARKWHQSPRS